MPLNPLGRRALRLIVIAAALAATFPSTSAAGVYKVRACDAAEGTNNSWQPFSSRVGVTATVACPSNGSRWRGISAHNVVARGSARKTVKRGTFAELVSAAPLGTSIVGIRAGYYFYRADPSWLTFLSSGLQPLRGCYRGHGTCESTATSKFTRVPASPSLFVGIVCKAARCPVTPTGDGSRNKLQAIATLYSAVVTLEDDSNPVITDASGPLLTDGWKAGKQGVHLEASDNSGISDLSIVKDTDLPTVASNACDSTRPIPCPPGATDFVVDTSTMKPDGPHSVTFVARDAAGNASQVRRDLLVDNTPPAAPDQLMVDGGDGWSRSNAFTVGWHNPFAGQGAPIAAAAYQLCPASGGPCQTGEREGTDITSLDGLAVPDRGDWLLRVWLRDAAGNANEDAAPQPVHLRFDDEAPEAVFLPEDPEHPTEIHVQVTDRYSGLASGTIELKKSEATAWRPLATEVRDGQLVAALDDEHLADGVYDLRAWADDYAGNVTATATRADGSRASVTLPLRLPTRLRAGAIRSVRARHGKRRQVLRRPARTRVGKRVRLGGVLTSGDGNPIADADILVSEQDGAGRAWTPAATLRTGRKGRYSYRAPAGLTREIRFQYAGTTLVRAAEATVPIRVQAVTSIRVNRHSVRNGRATQFEGRLKGGYVPSTGKLVEMQVLLRERWQTFTTLTTDANGRWRYRYRFTGTRGRITYTFRAKIPGEATYPFVAGTSRRVKVVVRG